MGFILLFNIFEFVPLAVLPFMDLVDSSGSAYFQRPSHAVESLWIYISPRKSG